MFAQSHHREQQRTCRFEQTDGHGRSRAQGLDSLREQPIRQSRGDDSQVKLVPRLLRAFRRKHPHIRFSLLQGPHEELLDHVRSGRADLAFTAPLPGPGEFAAIALEEQQLVVTVPTEHRLAGRAWIRMADLAREPTVGMKPGYGLRQITDELAEAAGFLPKLAFEGDDVDTLRGLIATGLGVAVLPTTPRPRPGTVEIPLRPKATRHIGLIWGADHALTPAALAFRDFVISGA